MKTEKVTTAEQFQAIMDIRFEVFVREQGVSVEGERDAYDDDPSTVHCIVTDAAGTCLGTGRLVAPVSYVEGEGNPHIGRVAVSSRTRTAGVGRAIMDFLEREALHLYGRDGTVRVELSAQDQAAGFYRKLGYHIHGERYLDEGIWHHDAYRDVDSTSVND